MRIAIYSPYLDTFGGGEKYMMTIAEVLSLQANVDVFLDKHLYNLGANYLKSELSQRFNLNLNSVNFTSAPVGKHSSIFYRPLFLKNYDVLFYLTDGSIFFPTAKKNILHIQSPLVGQPAKSAWGKFKLNGWDLIIYNSEFTKQSANKNWPIKSEIIYPPIDVDKIKPLNKHKYILSVGRFFGYLEDKKQKVLIKAFKELFESGQIEGWGLHLVGAAGDGDRNYLADLHNLAEGLPIKFYPNLEYDNLIKSYGESSIYWHAAGFEETNPIKMEHFGISTVEAMAGGCIPVVIGKGGQREIVEDGRSGYLWETLDDLKKRTLELIADDSLRDKMSKQAITRAKNFSNEIFENKILGIIKNR